MKNKKLFTLVPGAVALAMGVVGIILSILGQSQETITMLLSIAVMCLGFVVLNNNS